MPKVNVAELRRLTGTKEIPGYRLMKRRKFKERYSKGYTILYQEGIKFKS